MTAEEKQARDAEVMRLREENEQLRERMKRRETLLAEIRDEFILHFRLLAETSGNKKEQTFISRWRDRIDEADCYGASSLVVEGDKLYVGREVWTISRPEAKEGGTESIPAMLLPENDSPVFRVDCRRLLAAGCTEDIHAELHERAEKAEAVVSAARAYREGFDTVMVQEQWLAIRRALLDAIDAYDRDTPAE